ncbi:Trp biosynthesis-associated membrane protein [Nonomuraea sp. NN258]|uniref:Trp biosynthesis-associated membrane protein n=1 Tax=Nonomuraea antri TaxID=2730852 RepID=UPI001569D2F3|nr:Trp biosynthesis-associated membrane protein [Nonomuraea antri]NRQ36199.1 Trp biosynthesis-associated membrane protein [Nonomuraea antri]
MTGAEAGAGAGAGARAGSGRRELWGWVVLTALGCLLVLLAGGQAWVRLLGRAGDVTAPAGGDLSPVLTPVALAGLAGVVAVLATAGLGRRLIGALLTLCGIVAGVGVWTGAAAGTVDRWLAERDALGAARGVEWELVAVWPVVAGAGAALMVIGGVVAVIRGGAWAGMSAKYERGESRKPAHVSKDRELWDALDRGDDPTDSR